MTELLRADVRERKLQPDNYSVVHKRPTGRPQPVMVVAETYIPVRRLQRLAPIPKFPLRLRRGRIAMFVAFFACFPVVWFLPELRVFAGLFMLFDATVFVLTDERPHLQVRVARPSKVCGER